LPLVLTLAGAYLLHHVEVRAECSTVTVGDRWGVLKVRYR
jgi:hypothetical protein